MTFDGQTSERMMIKGPSSIPKNQPYNILNIPTYCGLGVVVEVSDKTFCEEV